MQRMSVVIVTNLVCVVAGASDDIRRLACSKASLSYLLHAASAPVRSEHCRTSRCRARRKDWRNGRLSDPTREQASDICCPLVHCLPVVFHV